MTELESLIITANITRYRKLLEVETHSDKRALLLRLLESEMAKPAAIDNSRTGNVPDFSIT